MKKLFNSVSPFIMLLLPIFMVIGLLIMNSDNEIPAEKYNASIHLQVLSFKVMLKQIF